jgi:hypothetical protein
MSMKSRRAAVIASYSANLDRELKTAESNGLTLPRPVINELLEELGVNVVADVLRAYNEDPSGSRRTLGALKARMGLRAGGSRWDAVASAAAAVK